MITVKIIKRKDFNDVTNWPKSFGFHIASKNIRKSVVFIQRVCKRIEEITKYAWKKTLKRKTIDKRGTKRADFLNRSLKPWIKRVCKRIGEITKCPWKKTLKRKTIDKRGTKREDIIKPFFKPFEVETIKPNEFTGDRKWCWDEFEQHIGVPKRSEKNPRCAMAYIQAKKYQRFVPEAKPISLPKGECTVFLASSQPRRYCLCPDHECLCFGNANKRIKIPKNCASKWSPGRYFKIFQICQKQADMQAFIERFIEASEHSTRLNMTGDPQVCFMRCQYRKSTAMQRDKIVYLPSFRRGMSRLPDKKPEVQKVETHIHKDRICNSVSCSVSTQTDTGPDEALQMGDFSHLLFSNNKSTYLPDIRGNKLQITHYTHVSPEEPEKQVCARNMERLLDIKEIKLRLSKFISSIYEIKDPGTPVRTSSTQVPWRQRIGDSFRISAPNRSEDEDYDKIPKVPWTFKMHEAIFDKSKKDENEEPCPCCELFAGSDIDKETLLDDIRNVLTLPGIEIPIKQLVEDENITDVKSIIEEIVMNTFDDIDEIINKENKDTINTLKSDKELEETVITGENRNDKESIDKNILATNEMFTENYNPKLQSSFMKTGKVLNEIEKLETDNNKERVECEFLMVKKKSVLSSSKTINQIISESRVRNKSSNFTVTKLEKKCNEDDNNAIEINHNLKKSDVQVKLESNKDLSSFSNINKKSCLKSSKTMKAQEVASNIRNTSKDEVVLQLNTSYKKTSSAFSTLFKWLFGQSILKSQIKKISSSKTVSKETYSTDNGKLSGTDSKNSEKEVFSIRYTSSTISVNKSINSSNK